MRDFSHIVRRLGKLRDIGEAGEVKTEIQNIEARARDLYKSTRRANSDPFRREHPPNAGLSAKNQPTSAYTNPFGGQRGDSGIYAKLSLSHSGILFAFFRKGYMAKKLTDPHAASAC